MRTSDNDSTPASVTVEEVAYGISSLECPVYADPLSRWMDAGDAHRDLCRAQARYVLGLAEDVDPEALARASGMIRWAP